MRWIIATVLMALTGSGYVKAADIQTVNIRCFYYSDCRSDVTDAILISGEIVKGDVERFRAAVNRSSVVLQSVILRSPGGDVDEAIKIGHDVRRLLLETEGPDLDYASDELLNYLGGDRPVCVENGFADYQGSKYKGTDCICASACFFIYAAGVRRNKAYVGIHRIYFDAAAFGSKTLDEVSRAYAEIKKPLREYLETMNVPHRYADIMLQTSSREIYVPTYPDVMADFFGWAPEVEEWLIARCETISEKELAEADKKAFQDREIETFLKLRGKREACIQELMLSERVQRRKAY